MALVLLGAAARAQAATGDVPVEDYIRLHVIADGDDEAAQLEAGIEYACDQVVRLADAGVDGIHIYTMNRPEIGRAAREALLSCGYFKE